MQITHKIQLDPTKDQITQFEKACGCARFSYNWALHEWSEMYKQWKGDNTLPKPNAFRLKKKFNIIKEKEFPWIYESPKDVNQQVFVFLGKAFTSFFRKTSKYPQFKKKFGKNSFYISNSTFSLDEKSIRLPVIGNVKMTENLRFSGKINSATVSKEVDKWFVSISIDVGKYTKNTKKINKVIGIDLGLKTFAVCSTGETFDAPKPLQKYKLKLARLQRSHCRKQKGSKNREKSRLRLAKLHYKISNIRKDFLHKLSTKICSENQTIVLEDLKVKNMMKNHQMAKSISDASWSEFRRQIQYKSEIFGNKIVLANSFMPSSKTCSKCGNVKKDLTLKDRTFVCNECGFSCDRDLNASFNLSTLGSSGTQACGQCASTADVSQTASVLVEARNNQCKSGNTFLHKL